MKLVKNVVFDLGGVVLDWSPNKIKEGYTKNPELTEFLFKNNQLHGYWHDFDRGVLSEAEMVGLLAEASDNAVEECQELMDYIKYTLDDIPETTTLIERLSVEGYKLYCLSNLSVDFYEYLKEREFFSYLDGRIISALEKTIKPDLEIYNILLDRYELNPRETLFIDDLKPNIEAADSLGFQTVHFADRVKGYLEIEEKLALPNR